MWGSTVLPQMLAGINHKQYSLRLISGQSRYRKLMNGWMEYRYFLPGLYFKI